MKTLWTEAHRPTSLEEFVWVDPTMRAVVQHWLDDGALPHCLFSGTQGTGKAQPLDSRVLTPNGWRLMGELQVGNLVLTPTGAAVPVIGVFPQGEKPVYRIEFDDGKSAECCAEHLWEVCHTDWRQKDQGVAKGIRILPLDAIKTKLDHLAKMKSGHRLGVPVVTPLPFPVASLPIDPYVLGALIGDDGCLREQGSLGFSSGDAEMIDFIKEGLGDAFLVNHVQFYDYRIIQTSPVASQGKKGIYSNPLKNALSELNLLGCRSAGKFIPASYKMAGIEQRFSLVQGLMDTDGTVSQNGGAVSFTTVSDQLARDVQEVIWSLGGVAKITTRTPTYTYNSELHNGQLAFTVHIRYREPSHLFKLARKKKLCPTNYQYKETLCNFVKSIELLDMSKSMQCIAIDDPNHLYVTDCYLPTHNTSLAKLLLRALAIPAADILYINASRERQVDAFQNRIMNFIDCWAMGPSSIKYILLDEADRMSPTAQGLLRNEMETYADMCRFVMTANYPNRIIPAIHSRVQQLCFPSLNKNDFIMRLAAILDKEQIDFEPEILLGYVDISYPDLRKCINLAQQNARDGKLHAVPTNDGDNFKDYLLTTLDLFRRGRFAEARKVVVAQIQLDEYDDFYRMLYQNTAVFGRTQRQQDDALLLIRKALIHHAVIADPEINLSGLLIELSRLQDE